MPVQAATKHADDPGRSVTDRARELGFALVGISPAKPSRYADQVRQWIADGRHGEMGYLANHLDVRLDPGKLVEGARSVICVADKHAESIDTPPPDDRPKGRIARYAFGRDYHKSMKKRLHRLADELKQRYPEHTFRSTVDTAPILEREYAALAGLGWIGKHTLLIHPKYGSYFLLGTIVTTLGLTHSGSDAALLPGAGVDHCGTCTRCIDACPTQCINTDGPRALDATRCISYLTLEHRSAIDESLHQAMGDWVAGCDVCQEVCPHNRERGTGIRGQDGEANAIDATDKTPLPRTRICGLPLHPDHTPRPPAPAFDLLSVLDWDEDDRREVLRGSALKRMKLEMIKRNALIALGNALAEQDDPAAASQIQRIAQDDNEYELVRLTARQVLARLQRGSESTGP